MTIKVGPGTCIVLQKAVVIAAGANPARRAAAAVSPGVNRLAVRLAEEGGLRRQVEGRAGDAGSRSMCRGSQQQSSRTIIARNSRVFEIAFFIFVALIARALN